MLDGCEEMSPFLSFIKIRVSCKCLDERTQNSSPTSSNGSTNSEGGEAPPHPILVGSSQWGSLSISSTAMSSNFSSPSGAASSHQNHHLTSVHVSFH
jgi:hypothetical protein